MLPMRRYTLSTFESRRNGTFADEKAKKRPLGKLSGQLKQPALRSYSMLGITSPPARVDNERQAT